MVEDCIFCKIIRGEIPGDTVYQDEDVTAFRDIDAQAPTHILVVPNHHIASLNDARKADAELLGNLLKVSALVAIDEGIEESGYRVVTNVGENGGQTVKHLHFHVVGGTKLSTEFI